MFKYFSRNIWEGKDKCKHCEHKEKCEHCEHEDNWEDKDKCDKCNHKDNCKYLYNVNEILVKPCYREKYIKFIYELNKYLLCKYGNFFAGLQLYEDKEDCNKFFVIARYCDICGVYEIVKCIAKDINCKYEEKFGDNVQRISIVSFVDLNKIIC